MPVVAVKLWDLARLVGTELSMDVLEDLFVKLKLEVSKIELDEVMYEAPHDRLDLYSAEGLARAIAYQVGLRAPRKFKFFKGGLYVDASSAPSYRPYVFMTIVRGVKLDDEAISQLFQLQEKLHLTHCGNRELVSIGLYDLDTVSFPVYYREVPDVAFVPLGSSGIMSVKEILEKTEKGREYGNLVKEGHYPLLVDSQGKVLSLPPIINSEETKVTERTKNVLIDVTGTEPYLMVSILAVMTTSVYERGASEIEIVRVVGRNNFTEEVVERTLSGKYITVSLGRITNLIGLEVPAGGVPEFLRGHGYVVEQVESGVGLFKVWVPPYRVDVIDEDDLVEDIAISLDYNKISGKIEPPTHRGLLHQIEVISRNLRDILVGLGFTEVVNFILTDPDYLTRLGFSSFIEVKNPKMRIYSALRPALLPEILKSVSKNVKKYGLQSLKIFEVGDIIDPKTAGTRRNVAGAIYGPGTTLTDGLAATRTLLELLGLKPVFKPAENDVLFVRERSSTIEVSGVALGLVGEVHPKHLKQMELSFPLTLFEISVDVIAKQVQELKR